MLVNEKYIGSTIGVVHHIEGSRQPLARAGTLIVPEFGVIRLGSVIETTRGACRIKDAWSTLPKNVAGVLEIRGYEGAGIVQPLKPR